MRRLWLSAMLIHSGEKLLLAQDFEPAASGCRLDLGRLQNAGERVAEAPETGADLLIINRFGKRERDGKGLSYLLERALEANIPVVIAVSSIWAFWPASLAASGASDPTGRPRSRPTRRLTSLTLDGY